MLQVGDCLKVKTMTFNDVFGECVYRVDEVGIQPPERERREAGCMDGVKCTLLGGSGAAARPGMTIIDSTKAISANIKAGITEIISAEQAEMIVRRFKKAKDKEMPSTGVQEINW